MNNKKYKFENALEKINKEIICLSPGEVTFNNEIQQALLPELIWHMKQVDILFATVYRKEFYGGSYYDGLKVSKPDEYDLDLLLNLQKVGIETNILHEREYPGHVRIKANYIPTGTHWQKLSTWLDDDYRLIADKVRSWMEGVITKALDKAYCNDTNIVVETRSYGRHTLKVTMQKSGPAHTLLVRGMNIFMSIDLVPCLVFNIKKYPINLRNYSSTKQEFFVVPKNPPSQRTLWRLSFQEQESVIINGKNRLKPALKLMKRLRDNEGHSKIASYFLKTIFLWECERKPECYWNDNSLSSVFMEMMKTYRDCLKNYGSSEHIITYFWDERYDLLSKEKDITIKGIYNRISVIINDIETKNDEAVINKYLRDKKPVPQPNKPKNLDPVKHKEQNGGALSWLKSVGAGVGIAAAVVGLGLLAATMIEDRESEEQRRRQNNQNRELRSIDS